MIGVLGVVFPPTSDCERFGACPLRGTLYGQFMRQDIWGKGQVHGLLVHKIMAAGGQNLGLPLLCLGCMGEGLERGTPPAGPLECLPQKFVV